ncbi:MAG: ribonuclease P protein component [Rhodocyclales bacterium]|nr:ribonuclease P protein component [Rhodocyclales bacterium]
MRAVPRVAIASASDSGPRFSKGRRLHKPQEFAAVLSARKVVKGETFDLHFLDKDDLSVPRLGLVIPKRLAAAASLRNAIKRQGRETFRQLPLRPCDVVLRLKRRVSKTSAEFDQQRRLWRGEIEALLRRLGTPGA